MHHLPSLCSLLQGLKSLWRQTPYLLALACTLLLPVAGPAQTRHEQITTQDYVLDIKEWSATSELPSWRIGGFFQDSRGFIWLQSDNHFIRMDGKNMSEVKTFESMGRGGNYYDRVDIREDIHHNIWWYSQIGNEVKIFDPESSREYALPEYLGIDTFPAIPANSRMISMDKVIYFINSEQGTIWIYDGELQRCFQDDNQYYLKNTKVLADNVQYLPAPQNRFWIIHPDLGVILCDKRGATIAHYPALLPNEYGHFISVGNQLYYYPLAPSPDQAPGLYQVGSPEAPLPKAPPLPHQFSAGNFCGEAPGTVTIISNSNKEMVLYDQSGKSQDLLPLLRAALHETRNLTEETFDPNLTFFGQTSDGSFWLAGGSGLIQLRFKTKRFKAHFEGHSFRSFAWLDHNTFYGISYTKKIELYIFNVEKDLVIPSPFVFPSLYSVTVHNGELWLGGGQGEMANFDGTNQLKATYFPPSRPNVRYGTIPLFLPDGKILYGNSQGLVEVNSTMRSSRYLLEGHFVDCLFQDRAGDVWAGTSRGIYHLPTRATFLDTLPSGAPLTISHIHEAADRSFWLATTQGLVHWKPFAEDYQLFTTSDGLSNDNLHAVYAGSGDWLWLSSNFGIMAFNTQTKQVKCYFEKNGLAHSEQNFLAHSQGPDGRLYFGGVNGITSFDPENAMHADEVPSSVSIFVRKISYLTSRGGVTTLYQGLTDQIKSQIALPANTSQVSVHLALPFLDELESYQLEWRIDGYFPQWTPIESSGALLISGLPAGHSDLHIRTRNLKNSSELYSLIIPINKSYFFYQRLWFWLLVVTLVVLAVWLAIILRLRFLKETNLHLQQMVQEKTQGLVALNADIQRQKEHLEQIGESKNHLFNNISHEFRTPLTLIQGYADSLLATPPTNEIKAVITPATLIKEQSINLSEMIEEIMDLSRLQLGTIKLKKEPVNWTAFLRREFYSFEGQAQRKQLDYRLRIEPDETIFLAIDVQKMERILNNLISNAIKFTPAAGRILVSCSIRKEEVEIVVADTGPGIPLDEQAYIFDRYFQGSAAPQSSQTGYGIGLALCQEYAKLMNARLWVESQPGKGAAFFLAFPEELASVPVAPLQKRATADEVRPRTLAHLLQPHEQSHLLIVEDNEHIQDFLVEVLAEEYQISIANNGLEALAVLEREPDIDLILSDMMMPGMDGFTLLQSTRSHPVWGFIPFLMLTALTAEEGKLKALRLGVDAFITKPFELVELLTQVENLVSKQKKRKQYQTTLGSQDPLEEKNSTDQEEDVSKPLAYDAIWLQELEDIVQQNLSRTDFKISDIAFQLHISERTLRNYINNYTGHTPLSYLQKARLDKARQLIKQGRYKTLSEIAYAVGFKDAQYFARLFKEAYGKHPSDYMN